VDGGAAALPCQRRGIWQAERAGGRIIKLAQDFF